jgi:hypothetical protein
MSTCAIHACCAIALTASLASAQTGVFSGVVTGDALGHPVTSAEVRLPELNRVAQSNAQGEFRFADVPAGHYLVVVRAIGFNTFADSIVVADGQTLDGDLTLSPTVTTLDRIRTTAVSVKRIPPSLREFESRRLSSPTGFFLSDSALRRHDRETLSSVVGMLPGVHTVFGNKTTTVHLASAKLASGTPCLFTVYKDGLKIFQMGDGSDEPPDFGQIRVEDYAGVEVYPTPAQTPAQYSATGTGCGVIVLWSRPIAPR